MYFDSLHTYTNTLIIFLFISWYTFLGLDMLPGILFLDLTCC